MGSGESRQLTLSRLRRPQNTPDAVKKLSTLSWDDFGVCVRSVNAKCRGLVNDEKEYFIFAVRTDVVLDDNWKEGLQIICVAKHVETGRNRIVRAYSLQRFLNIYHAFAMIPEVANVSDPLPTLTDSIFVECSGATSSQAADAKSVNENSCCICFDREADTILSCSHSFCTVCVATWSEYRTQFHCPLCKAAIRSPLKESWELSEQPTKEEMEGYFTSLMSQQPTSSPRQHARPMARRVSPSHSESSCTTNS